MIDNGRKRIIPNEVLLPEVARLISEGHTVTLTVRGNSMNPFLVDRRDRIVLGPFTDNDLHLNTVVPAFHSLHVCWWHLRSPAAILQHFFGVLCASAQAVSPSEQ